MTIPTTINHGDLQEIRDHIENTARDLIKWYTTRQLSIMDKQDSSKIKRNPKYLPVRIDTSQSLWEFRRWRTRKPYKIFYIRLDEIRYIFNKRTGKKLVIE